MHAYSHERTGSLRGYGQTCIDHFHTHIPPHTCDRFCGHPNGASKGFYLRFVTISRLWCLDQGPQVRVPFHQGFWLLAEVDGPCQKGATKRTQSHEAMFVRSQSLGVAMAVVSVLQFRRLLQLPAASKGGVCHAYDWQPVKPLT